MLEVMPRNARLRIAELEAQVAERDARIAELEAQVKVLTRRVAELEAQLRKNSTNSSKPPSSDSPGVRRTPRVPTGRRPGGQPGHELHKRELLPPEQVDRFIDVPAPERCTSCDGKLEGGLRDALSELLGVRLSLGAIGNREQEMSEALSAPVAQAEQYVRDQEAANLDETGWYEGKENERHRRVWLWLAATALVAVFRISSSHGSDVAKALLGEDFAGFLTTDRWSAYNWYDTGLRQLCWSHLTRDFQGFIEKGGEGAPIGRALMAERNRMFKWWHRVRDGTLSREDFERRMRKVARKVGLLLRQAAVCAEEKTAGTAAKILQLEEAMWTFVQVEGLEPTNNFAERLIRPCVMYRKTSFGTQSPEGSRFMERILTAVTTLGLQQRNVLEYLTDLLYTHRRALPLPSLLPFTTNAQAAPPA
ncbi:IS66 family transposase [Archangium violaceum]|uniref:IS66 family transposase n=1 Tax=Archangium violaceum TaxID=83451 RepID=UPI0036D78634